MAARAGVASSHPADPTIKCDLPIIEKRSIADIGTFFNLKYSSEELSQAVSEAVALTNRSNWWDRAPDETQVISFYSGYRDSLEHINDYKAAPIEGSGDPDSGVETSYILDLARTYNLSKEQVGNIYKKILF